MFTSTLKLEAGVSKFLPYKSVFGKLWFRDGLLLTMSLTRRRNEAGFSNFPGALWSGP